MLRPNYGGDKAAKPAPQPHYVVLRTAGLFPPRLPDKRIASLPRDPSGPNVRLSDPRQAMKNPRHTMARCELRVRHLVTTGAGEQTKGGKQPPHDDHPLKSGGNACTGGSLDLRTAQLRRQLD